MSTVKAINFQHPSATQPSITLAADGSMTGALPAPNRNLLYNGAMQVAQRGTSTAGITADGYYTADRWNIGLSSLGTWTQSVENDGPSGSGLTKSLKMLCTTADASPAASDYALFLQSLEGQDVQRIAKGTASAQQLTLSFWVKSNVTGTFVASLFDTDNSRLVGQAYTISASGTWERKVLTFAADTSGVLNNDNDTSLQVYFGLASGSARTSGTLSSSWAAYSDANFLAGQTNLAAATNNYWQVTGVQLEVGPTATGFEFKSYGQELRECQRYYYQVNAPSAGEGYVGSGLGVSATRAIINWTMPVPMRAVPVLTHTGAKIADFANVSISVTALGNYTSFVNREVTFDVSAASGVTTYRPYFIGLSGSAAIFASAEL